jgi:cytochrome c oxidase cbb3-type subunit III
VTRFLISVAVAGLLALCGVGCEREARPFGGMSGASRSIERPLASALVAGGATPSRPESSPYQENAWGIAEGKRLYESFNCVGCHAHGGGGMGPALMDDKWIYGSHPANLFQSIVEGRANGMPAFVNKIADDQVWQIVAYVQAMSGHAPLAALPGRSDHLSGGAAENQRPAQMPTETGKP